MVIDLQRVVLMRVRQLHALHVGNPIGQYIDVRVVSSKKTCNGYGWVLYVFGIHNKCDMTLPLSGGVYLS